MTPTTRYKLTRRCTYQKLPGLLRLPKKRMPRSVDEVIPPVEDRNKRTRSKSVWFPTTEACTVAHWQDWCGKKRRQTTGQKYQLGKVSQPTENRTCSCPYMWTTSRWLDRRKIWDLCEKSSKRYRPGGCDPFAEPSIFGLQPERI